MEGPAFSTRAESLTNHQLGYDVIGMTNLGEAKCAREAEIAYATLAMSTDYDCWKEDEHVTLDMIIQNLHRNADMAKKIVVAAISQIPAEPNWPCHAALKNAILTDKKLWPKKTVTESETDSGEVSLNMDQNPKGPRESDRIATYVARIIVSCIGILLLVVFVALKIWKTASFEHLMMLGATIGLCLGYGLGGDILGARLFGFFMHLNTKGVVEQNETPFVRFASRAILFIAIALVVSFSTVLIIAYLNRNTAR